MFALRLPLAAKAVATLAADTVVAKPGMVIAGIVSVIAPDTAGNTKGAGAGAECVNVTIQATHTIPII